ncbi:MAG: aldo/keto reductase [Sphaerochaeta sp.]|nr:MAG: aldo/keto reductase [Sphaerochaeta sp.]HPY45487.1 aldo/keto reductase [Sphaerochaeta sp.]HQB05365.1 aldo/keto reductase [Sphaerochaeta sp.]
MEYKTFSNGVKIPVVGFGTWQVSPDEAYESVRSALEVGYRHIDTAAAYENEAEVGQAITDSGIRREEIFVTTKLWNGVRGYKETLQAAKESMEKLQVEYLDLYLIHWPNPAAHRHWWKEANAESWKAMEELYENGAIKAIGISNFEERHIEALLASAQVIPHTNQIRLFAGEQQRALVAYCRNKGMITEAYSPLGVGGILSNEVIGRIAKETKRTPAQVALRYNLQKDHVVLPKSVHRDRMVENLNLFDFELSREQMISLDALPNTISATRNPDEVPF